MGILDEVSVEYFPGKDGAICITSRGQFTKAQGSAARNVATSFVIKNNRKAAANLEQVC
jgi:hypothetical protein